MCDVILNDLHGVFTWKDRQKTIHLQKVKHQAMAKARLSARGFSNRHMSHSYWFAVFGAYAFYLDAQIKHAFSGNKWEVPAQIFARPLEISNVKR